MLLKRTDKARNELQPGVRTLGQRERSLLLMANGSKSLADLAPMFEGQGKQLAQDLMTKGFLEPLPGQAAASDSFDGKRSMATTRMFLFDICERMFARRDPLLAERFREALRQAKDRESMLDASRDMIAEIERVAGHERADSISERIAMLLPAEAVS